MLQGLKHLFTATLIAAASISAQALDLQQDPSIRLLPPVTSNTSTISTDNLDEETGLTESHYTIDDATPFAPPVSSSRFSNPISWISLSMTRALETVDPLIAKNLVLTRWIRHNGAPATPSEKYQRMKHYGRWINDPNDDTCYDTRAQVLIRDSQKKVSFGGNKNCRVATGLWKDPYAG